MVWGWRVRWARASSRALWLFRSGVNQSNKKKKTEETIFAQITHHTLTRLFLFFSLFSVSQPKKFFFLLLNKQTSSGCETDADYAMILWAFSRVPVSYPGIRPCPLQKLKYLDTFKHAPIAEEEENLIFQKKGKLGIRNWFRLPRVHHVCSR